MSDMSVLLIVLDGWGLSKSKVGNAIAAARPPVYASLLKKYPHTRLLASGEAVGLPEGQMGNSEVGHLNLGAGRIVYQDITRINKAIRDGDFFNNTVLRSAMESVKQTGGALHVMGLLSDGGVHSHIDHLTALFYMAKTQGVSRAFFHAFLDGRDTPPASALQYIEHLEASLSKTGIGSIATVMGRFYAMDRDKRWDRMQKAYEAMVQGRGTQSTSASEAVKQSYDHGRTDEFVVPAVILDEGSERPKGSIQDGDAVIFCNFRSDRAREITQSLTDPQFNGFPRSSIPKLASYVCMTTYDETFGLPVAFPSLRLHRILGEVLSDHGIRQLRIAETEKYAHVTFFFNGGEEPPFRLEERNLIPSPRDVATYDQKPEMSAREVTDELIKQIKSGQFGFMLANFANPDMVGHTGVFSAAVKAVSVLDECLGRVVRAAQESGTTVLITSDHGNVEMMTDAQTGQPHTAHTSDAVPFILVGEQTALGQSGLLADVAPTVLQLMGIEPPAEMTGKSLIR